MPTLPLIPCASRLPLPAPAPCLQDSFGQALMQRHSSRTFRPDPLPANTLAALLWAGFGVNRPVEGGRTAPSACNWQEISVYVVMAQGTYRYDPRANCLLLVSTEDLRANTGTQDFVAQAPLNLVYVADYALMTPSRDEDRHFLAGADTGFIAENIYLCCAQRGLATVVRAMIDRHYLAHLLGLSATQHITLAQSIGYAGEAQGSHAPPP